MAAGTFITAYAGLLSFPQPFFAYSLRAHHLVLHSDQSIPEAEAIGVLQKATAKLEKSPLYSASEEHHIFVCNARWRQMLFFNKDYGVGGVSPNLVSRHVFLRDSRIAENRLISPLGIPVPGDRTLDYYIAHEVTHQLTSRAIGMARFYLLPQYVREGYADYVGKGGSFAYEQQRRGFLAGVPEMDYKKSGLYLRFHLLTAYLLDRRGWSADKLLHQAPPQEEVEQMLKGGPKAAL